MRFPIRKQYDAMDCGPTCLQMIAEYYGQYYSLQTLREKSYLTRNGSSLKGISSAAKSIGFKTESVWMNWEQLIQNIHLPCIIHWDNNHFIVVYYIKSENKIIVADPALGKLTYNKEDFLKHWITDKKNNVGIVFQLKPTSKFYENKPDTRKDFPFKRLFKYIKPHKKYLSFLITALTIGCFFNLSLPFLTQAIVDIGITTQKNGIILIICIAQLMLIAGQLGNELFQSWLMLHMTQRISITFISDFLNKLMRLPIAFFDTKLTGDIMQRISDNNKIQKFLTSTLISSVFSLITFTVFSIVIGRYSLKIFLFFLIGSSIYVMWVLSFIKKCRVLNFREFREASSNQSNLVQLVASMQEIKLNNCERGKRWEWENIQFKLYQINIKSLAIAQLQGAGGAFINQIKNVIISYLAATSVVKGEMTLGMMIAIQYVLGQLNTPLNQFLNFIKESQEAKISLERINEIYDKPDEEPVGVSKITNIPSCSNIIFQNVTFCYGNPESEKTLKNINLIIEAGKVTAIVGASGSGKTTLLKLLLGFYPPTSGIVCIGEKSLTDYSAKYWRRCCGVVMQEGFIFSDSIAKNIGIIDEELDYDRLHYAARLANIDSFINSLPLGYETKIGSEGCGLSNGQKQRILIARAIYKNPNYIFLDEATNSLDTTNETIIMENLQRFYSGRTVVIVAHRLSTVRNADKIIVLHHGEIVEVGTHETLISHQGIYYQLIENQLELNKNV